MPIQLKRSLTSGSLPTTASLVSGELALNVPDGRIFLRKSGSGSDTIQSAITTGAQNSGSIALTGSLSLYSPTGSVLDVSGDVVSIDGDVIEIAADTMEFTGSFVNSGSLRVIGNSIFTGSAQFSGSVVVSGSLTVAGNFFGSVATASLALTASFATSASLAFTASSAENFFVRNTLTASILYASGSSRFGRLASDQHIFTGSVIMSGSTSISGSFAVLVSGSNREFAVRDTGVDIGNILTDFSTLTGSLRLTGSLAISGSTSVTGGLYIAGITTQIGNVALTGSINASQGYTGSLFGTASWATNAILFPFTGSARITGSMAVSGTFSVSGSQILFVAQDIFPTGSISSSYFTISGSVRQPPIVGSRGVFVDIAPTMGYATSSQVNTAFRLNATFSGSSAFTASQNNIIADFGSTSAGSQLTITDVTSGSIYMVNDVSGLPIIEANSNWEVFIYDYPNTVFKKSGSTLELGVSNNTSSAVIVEADLIINEGYGITHRTTQVSASTAGNVTSSLYTLSFTNISSSVFLSAIVTGYDTGSRDTITGEIKGTIRYRAGVATLIGNNYSYANSDNSIVNFELFAGGTSGSILVYGTGSRTYQWGATVTTQII